MPIALFGLFILTLRSSFMHNFSKTWGMSETMLFQRAGKIVQEKRHDYENAHD
jgi:hypothetical protein